MSEKFKVLKISSIEYNNSRHFPKNIPNKPEFPENPAHLFQKATKNRISFGQTDRHIEQVKRAGSPALSPSRYQIPPSYIQEERKIDFSSTKVFFLSR